MNKKYVGYFAKARFKPEDYDKVIDQLQDAKRQGWVLDKGCSICTDSCHHADQCHHNPLYHTEYFFGQWYKCYHCGGTFQGDAARQHFGENEFEEAHCQKQISQLKKEIRLLGSMAGNPDAVKGCQLIVKKVREVLDE